MKDERGLSSALSTVPARLAAARRSAGTTGSISLLLTALTGTLALAALTAVAWSAEPRGLPA
jgi:hypothetical protein